MQSESDRDRRTEAVRESNWTAASQRLGLPRGNRADR